MHQGSRQQVNIILQCRLRRLPRHVYLVFSMHHFHVSILVWNMSLFIFRCIIPRLLTWCVFYIEVTWSPKHKTLPLIPTLKSFTFLFDLIISWNRQQLFFLMMSKIRWNDVTFFCCSFCSLLNEILN